MDFSLISSPKYFFEEMYGDQSGEWRLIQQQNVNVINDDRKAHRKD